MILVIAPFNFTKLNQKARLVNLIYEWTLIFIKGGNYAMDKKDFARRVELLKSRLYRTAYLYLGNEVSAMEAVDEAVYKGLRARNKLREHQYFDTWLTRILINECKKELRRLKRIRPMEYLPESEAEAYNYDTLPLKEAIF